LWSQRNEHLGRKLLGDIKENAHKMYRKTVDRNVVMVFGHIPGDPMRNPLN
jgi:hypothetical protein